MRNIPENNFAYPVFLEWDSGSSGSGCRILNNGIIYFVTAKHVLFDAANTLRGSSLRLKCQSEDINDDSVYLLDVDMKMLEASKAIFFHPKYDVAGFIESTIAPTNGDTHLVKFREEIKLVESGKSRLIAIDTPGITFINDVLISNDVFLYGYPSSLGLKASPQFDYNKPLLRKGIVANVNKMAGTIILDCPVYYGNSGGPVVQVEFLGEGYSHQVIGIISEFIPYSEMWENLSNGLVHTEISNSGYSVAVAMDYVFEMFGIKK